MGMFFGGWADEEETARNSYYEGEFLGKQEGIRIGVNRTITALQLFLCQNSGLKQEDIKRLWEEFEKHRIK